MYRFFLIIVLLAGLAGCRGYKHAICVSVESPLLPHLSETQHSALKVEYRFEENTPAQQAR